MKRNYLAVSTSNVYLNVDFIKWTRDIAKIHIVEWWPIHRSLLHAISNIVSYIESGLWLRFGFDGWRAQVCARHRPHTFISFIQCMSACVRLCLIQKRDSLLRIAVTWFIAFCSRHLLCQLALLSFPCFSSRSPIGLLSTRKLHEEKCMKHTQIIASVRSWFSSITNLIARKYLKRDFQIYKSNFALNWNFWKKSQFKYHFISCIRRVTRWTVSLVSSIIVINLCIARSDLQRLCWFCT